MRRNIPKVRIISLIFFISVYPVATSQGQTSNLAIQDLNHSWQFTYNKNNFPAMVPGCIHTDLLTNKLIPDPFYGSNDSSLQWIGRQNWIYSLNFDVSDQVWKKEETELVFEGLDTYAEVFLNDSLVLLSDNMFRKCIIPCRKILQKKNNRIIIIFRSADNTSKDLYEAGAFRLPGEERVMTRKAQFQYGWDFGPRFLTCGIWKKVMLCGWNHFNVTSVVLQTDSINEEAAHIKTTLMVHANSGRQLTVTLTDKKSGALLGSSAIGAAKGLNRIEFYSIINNPRRWWCNGYGNPELYDLQLEIRDNQQTVFDTLFRYGLRSIELVQEPDSMGSSFYFRLNGVPVFMKGANYVPMDIFPARITDSLYDALLSDALQCNFNMLRVWGGGVYENNEFYSLCDEKGILIWQDFMFACGMYPFDTAFFSNVSAEALQQTARLSSHPCITLYCGNNEIAEGWARWGWQDDFSEEERREIQEGYRVLFGEILPAAVKAHSNVPYWESSPSLGRGDPEHTLMGDAHNWFVWHDGEPFENYRQKVPRFMSEFGFQSYPATGTIALFADVKKGLAENDVQSHQKNHRGNAIIRKYMKDNYGMARNDEDFVYLSQVQQADGVCRGIIAHRNRKPYNMGSLYWQFNDCWPGISWSSRDYYGNWKALQYASRRAFAPLLVTLARTGDSLTCTLVNDSLSPVAGSLEVSIFNFNGSLMNKFDFQVYLPANKVTTLAIPVSMLPHHGPDSMNMMVEAVLSSGNKQLSCGFLYPGKTKDLPLQKPEIKYTGSLMSEGFAFNLTTDKPARGVWLSTSSGGVFSENFFDMVPGRSYPVFLKKISGSDVPSIRIKTIFDTR